MQQFKKVNEMMRYIMMIVNEHGIGLLLNSIYPEAVGIYSYYH